MKKKLLLPAFLAVLSVAALQAAPVSLGDARKIAQDFYTGAKFSQGKKVAGDFTCVYPPSTKNANEWVPYYIFNVGTNGGFVIVAGDDNASHEVLAYSDKGSFDYENRPANVAYWLDYYTEEMHEVVLSAPAPKKNTPKDRPYQGGEIVVAPILGSIAYNQDAPYNRMCPTYNGKNMPTGCAATAMAAICKRYEYPAQGRGYVSYNPATYGSSVSVNLSANLDEDVYDWEKILPYYEKVSYSDEQADAVALLMRDIGYGMLMQYDKESSGATIVMALKAAVKNMSYDSSVSIRTRDYFVDQDEWNDMLKRMLNAGHPLYYTGHAVDGGHAFVMDGYDADDYFHVHWGWGGVPGEANPKYDGYYLSYILNPGEGGIGSGHGAYRRNQNVLYNLVPPGDSNRLKDVFQIGIVDAMSCNEIEGNQVATFRKVFNQFQNPNAADFNGKIAFAAYKDGEFLQIVSEEQPLSLAGILSFTNNWYTIENQRRNIALTASAENLEDGDYDIYVVTRPDEEDAEWVYCHALANPSPSQISYIPVTVEDGKFTKRVVHSTLSINLQIPINRNVYFWMSRDGFQFENMRMAGSNSTTTVDLLSNKDYKYTFTFYTVGFDTAYVRDLVITGDTTVTVRMRQTMADPYIYVARVVDGNNINFYWMKQSPQYTGNVNPKGYILYLDSVPVATAGSYEPEKYGMYVFENLTPGVHNVGVRAVYLEDTTNLIGKNLTTTEPQANELLSSSLCRLSPNPSADGRFMLEVPCACGVQVYSSAGSVVKELEIKSEGRHELDLGGCAPGMYLVRLFTANKESLVLKAFVK